jgi:glycosyltransferase involved in cell wall biosynthesis
MPRVYSALDVAVSSSHFGEGFSNAIGEAMACGVPCVVTDVGDSALVVGETGIVVPPGQVRALASGIEQVLEAITTNRETMARACRHRIVAHFGSQQMVKRVEAILEGLG